MQWLSCEKMRLVLVGFLAIIVVGGGRVKADFTFGAPVNLPSEVDSTSWDGDLCVSACGCFLFFGSMRPGGQGGRDIWFANRATVSEDWGTPLNLGATVNSPNGETDPSISVDLLSLYFRSNRPDGSGNSDLYVTTRATIEDQWGKPKNLGPTVNSIGNESDPCISADGLSLYFSTWNTPRPDGYGGDDIWVTTRMTSDDTWSEPINLGPTINTVSHDVMPSISSDGLVLFFASTRPGGFGSYDLYMSRRTSTSDPWGDSVNLGVTVNSRDWDVDPDVSLDGSTIYFCASDRVADGKTYDFWQVPILPIIDLNDDGIIDAADMCIMVDHWGDNYPLCDIGPRPWGDGIVDAQDLIVLSGYLFEDIPLPIELVSYWRLDEKEGDIAYDSAGLNAGILVGGPVWQPADGKKEGSLRFDGIDDFISTDFVLDPSDGSLSVFTWIKGGAPGQVIISQTDGEGSGEIWLGADTSDGKLMTGLRPPDNRSPTPPMVSDFVITDGQWHHVGIVVTSRGVRYLYVDGIRVAADVKGVELPSSNGGLYIGANKNLDSDTFFSGLIDDVRIYDIALSAEEIAALAQ